MPAADAEDEVEKLDKAAGMSNVGNQVEVATENPVDEDDDHDEEDDEKEAQDDDEEWLAQQEERAAQVLF